MKTFLKLVIFCLIIQNPFQTIVLKYFNLPSQTLTKIVYVNRFVVHHTWVIAIIPSSKIRFHENFYEVKSNVGLLFSYSIPYAHVDCLCQSIFCSLNISYFLADTSLHIYLLPTSDYTRIFMTWNVIASYHTGVIFL